jgi:hypothetical protein
MTNKPVTSTHKPITSHEMSSDPKFGERVFAARKKLSWTQKHLGIEAHKRGFYEKEMHYNTICGIETRRSAGSWESRRVIGATISDALKCPYPWENDDEKLDKNSLTKFIRVSDLVRELDQEIAAAYKVRLILPDSFTGFILERLSHVGIKTISEVRSLLEERKQMIKKFAVACYKHPVLRRHELPHGACIGSLQVLSLLENGNVRALKNYLQGNRLNIQADPLKMTRALKIAYDEARKKFN